MTIAKFNESELFALGMGRENVAAFRHILEQVGKNTGQETLPQVAMGQEGAVNSLTGVQLLLTAARARITDLEAAENVPAPDNQLARRLDDLEAALERAEFNNAELIRRITQLEDARP